MSNSINMFDIDIDVAPKSCTDRSVYGVRAMVYNAEQEKILPHPSGVYLEEVPVDELTGLCAFDHKYGNEGGFIKADILSNSAYDKFNNKAEVMKMAGLEPDWNMLGDRRIVEKLPHIGSHYDELVEVNVRSIDDLADFLALIRPGKLHLVDAYLENKKSIRPQLYKRPANGKPYFKKSHAYSYAMMIIALMNKMNLFRFSG